MDGTRKHIAGVVRRILGMAGFPRRVMFFFTLLTAFASRSTAQTNISSSLPASPVTGSTNSSADSTNAIEATANPESSEGPQEYKKMSLEQLMSLDVTSVARQPQPYGQAPASIDVITQDEIRRSGASSIPEALRLADNLEVAQKDSHDWAISARGFNTSLANKLLVLMDGRTVYTPLFSGVFWDVQDYLLEDIDRIEVISGPGGTLWGQNAVNGVINITSKSAQDTQGLYVEGGGGSVLRDFGGVRYGEALASNVFLRVYGKYSDRGNEQFTNGAAASDSWQSGQGGFRMDVVGADQNNLTLQGDMYANNENDVPGEEAKASGGNVLGRWSHVFSEDADLDLQLYYDRTHLIDPIPAGFARAGFLTDDLSTYDLDFQDRFALGGRNRVVWGLGYRFTHDVVGDAPDLAFAPAVLDQDLYSGFLQDEFKIFDNLFFTLGTKIEHNSYTGFEEEPSARLQLNLTENHMLWAAVSRAVRAPSRVDRDEREPNSPTPILEGGANFESESVIAYEAGYRGRFGSNVSGSVSIFYNDYDHIRSVNFTPGTLFPLFFANDLKGYTYGLEASVNYQALDWWSWHAGYDLLEEHIVVDPDQFDLNNGLNETADPKHQVFLRSSMDLPWNLEMDAGLRWIDKLHINNGPTIGIVPSYFELDARLGWHPTKRIELSVVGQNLLHDSHVEYGFPGPTQEEITRNVYGEVALRW
jgi:iron complex outermembrane recepter protein